MGDVENDVPVLMTEVGRAYLTVADLSEATLYPLHAVDIAEWAVEQRHRLRGRWDRLTRGHSRTWWEAQALREHLTRLDVCPDCAGEWGKPMREGCKRPWHHADEWRWEQVAETTQGSGDDAWTVSVFQERGCDHEWLDRPESDTRVCELCAEER